MHGKCSSMFPSLFILCRTRRVCTRCNCLMPRDELCPVVGCCLATAKLISVLRRVLGGPSSFVPFVYQDVWILTWAIFPVVMKQRCISTHLHIYILLCNSASLCLNFLLDARHENQHLHMCERSSVWGTPPLLPLYSDICLFTHHLHWV